MSQRYQILIVEDNEINLEVACALVTKLGHSVTPAKDGTSALKSMLDNHYDLALLDINLPDIDGVTLSQQLKAMAKEKQQPLKTIAVSAHVFNEDIAKFIESGFDGFVAKPVQMKKLKPSIAKVMFNVKGSVSQRAEQGIEYLGSGKVKQLALLFCQQLNSEYSDFSSLSAIAQQALLHKLKGAAIGLDLVRLHQLCHKFEINIKDKKLTMQQLLIIDELTKLSKESLNQYAKSLKNN